ncbi:hypothetical protein [Bacillus sp. ISL-37]|uniref:hypothetical protein n=1 Tax=Bacillus sp. ISL-37 TaxID=2819123 RepID=UPI001BEB7778|nr:hypothetical protein [Bacillus sp. ISL-37]MBT2682666.1 hypothetical protein [Bacillus sp. ISL-37]
MNILVYCDTDNDGNIIDALIGANIIPSRQYDYFFFSTDAGVLEDIAQYKVNAGGRVLERRA